MAVWFLFPLGAAILFLSVFFWPQDKRTLGSVAVTAGVFSGAAILVALLIQIWPVSHIVRETKVVTLKYKEPPKVVIKTVEKVVYQVPGHEFDPVDVKAVCAGAKPMMLTAVSVAGKDDDKTTWFDGTLVGGKVKFTCGEPGDFGSWQVGDVIQIVRGTPQ